ncbi:hypothetical protein [Nonomuraea sp. NPDC049784]|uniref:hypothetical protein n=1 Tax=Nonomuraea sp. NPDC049784 TaxID=3154361 RepID=UPI0033F2FFB1
MTTVLCVPQWQGSASERAPRLAACARRAAELGPADVWGTVPVLAAAREKESGVRGPGAALRL